MATQPSNVGEGGQRAVCGQARAGPCPASLGAPGETSPGAAYVFTRSGTAWSQQAKLTASDGASRDSFGGLMWPLVSAIVVSNVPVRAKRLRVWVWRAGLPG